MVLPSSTARHEEQVEESEVPAIVTVFRETLLLPGPTEIPLRVQQAMSRGADYHRGPEFGLAFKECLTLLKQLLGTKEDVMVLPGTGRGGVEAALVNVLSPGDRVLAVSNGVFGEMMARIAEIYGADVIRIEGEWGRAVPPEEIEAHLRRYPDVRAVLVTHCESSTGVLHDIRAIGELVRNTEAILVVDAVSSLGGAPLHMDAWGLDVVIGASQKALMNPPGLTVLGLSAKGWQRVAESKLPRHFWDFRQIRDFIRRDRPETPHTTPTTLVYGLLEALRMINEEGLEAVWERHRRMARLVCQGVEGLGLSLLVPRSEERSPTVTAVRCPEGIDGKTVVKRLREMYNVRIGAGLRRLESSTFRVGHMGAVQEKDMILAVALLGLTLDHLGFDTGAPGAALRQLFRLADEDAVNG